MGYKKYKELKFSEMCYVNSKATVGFVTDWDKPIYRMGDKSLYTDQYAPIIWSESRTPWLHIHWIRPYVHLDAGHTNGCTSMSSVTYVGALLE